MWPVIYGLGTRFSRYLVLPIAAVVGTVGWYLEKKYRPGSWSKPVPYLNSSIQEQREKRQTSQPVTDPYAEKVVLPLPNSLGVNKPRPID